MNIYEVGSPSVVFHDHCESTFIFKTSFIIITNHVIITIYLFFSLNWCLLFLSIFSRLQFWYQHCSSQFYLNRIYFCHWIYNHNTQTIIQSLSFLHSLIIAMTSDFSFLFRMNLHMCIYLTRLSVVSCLSPVVEVKRQGRKQKEKRRRSGRKKKDTSECRK